MSQKFSQNSPQRFGTRPFQGKSFMEQQRNQVVSQTEEEYQPVERDWRSRRKPLGKVYTDTGPDDSYVGWNLRYDKKESASIDPALRGLKPRNIATDFGRVYNLDTAFVKRSYGGGHVQPLQAMSEEDYAFEQAYKESKFIRLIAASGLSSEEKEYYLSTYIPGASEAFAYGRTVTASHKFYHGLGYPQFAGKYAPFIVPSGAKIKGISETSEGLKIEYEPSSVDYRSTLTPHERYEESMLGTSPRMGAIQSEPLKLPKALGTLGFTESLLTPVERKVVEENWLSDWLYSVKLGSVIDPLASAKQGKIVGIDVRPFAPLAAVITPFEWATYEAATILRGGKGAIGTPPQTPSFTQMVVSGTTKDYPSYYVSGSLLGELAFSEFLGKAFGLASESVKPYTGIVTTSKPYIQARGSYYSFVNWLKTPVMSKEQRLFNKVFSDKADETFEVIGQSSDETFTDFSKGLKYEKPSQGFTSQKMPITSFKESPIIDVSLPSEEELYFRAVVTTKSELPVIQSSGQMLVMQQPKQVFKEVAGVATKELSFAEMAPMPMLQFWSGKAYPFMSPSRREEDETELTVLSYPTKGSMVAPLLDKKAYSTSSSRLVESRTGKIGTLGSPRIGSLSIGKIGSLGIAKTHLTMMSRSNVFTSSRVSLKQVQPQLLSQPQPYMQKTLQKTKLSRRDFEMKPKQPKRKGKQEKIKGLGAYKRKYPLATAEEFVRTFI